MDLCLAEDCRQGPRVSNQWWENYRVDVEEMQAAAWEAERMKGEEETYMTDTEIDKVGGRIT